MNLCALCAFFACFAVKIKRKCFFKKVGGNAPGYYILDGNQTVAVMRDGMVDYWNIVANGVAGRYEPESGNKFYYLKDHLGSTRAVVNASGTVVEAHDYYPFGLLMPGRTYQSGSETKEKFIGKERDSETGMDYFGARYYNPVLGRWLAVDPYTNLVPHLTSYHYARNNPINRYDEDGRADFGSAKKLKEAGMKVIADPSLKASNGVTYCNFGCQRILNAGGDNSLNGMLANEIFDFLSNTENASQLSYEEAVVYAKEGVTIILAAKNEDGHGHVAVVAPEDMVYSGSFGKNVPQIFNVGNKNGLMKASLGFSSKNQPTAFILNADKESADKRISSSTSTGNSNAQTSVTVSTSSVLTNMMRPLLGIDPSKSPQAVWNRMHKAKQDKTRVNQ